MANFNNMYDSINYLADGVNRYTGGDVNAMSNMTYDPNQKHLQRFSNDPTDNTEGRNKSDKVIAADNKRKMAKLDDDMSTVANDEINEDAKALDITPDRKSSFSEMMDAIIAGGGMAIDDAGSFLSDAGDYVSDKYTEHFNNPKNSDETNARRQYLLADGLRELVNTGVNSDANRLNILAANLGYAGRVPKDQSKNLEGRLYEEALAGKSEKNQIYQRELGDMYLKMLKAKTDKMSKG